MKKLILVLGLASVLLSACSPVEEIADTPSASPTQSAEEQNEFEQGCAEFNSGTLQHKYLETYTPIIADICKDLNLNYDLVEVIASEGVDPFSVKRYVNANVFGLSYWSKYVTGEMPKTYLVLLMEDEKDWWQEKLSELLTIEPVWFGPTDGGGHCYAAEAQAFCPKLYIGNEGDTQGDYNVLSTMLGSSMEWSAFRRVVAIHESTHAFQTTELLGHWRYWYVEGQATYFELAASVLVPAVRDSNWRDEQLKQAHQNDQHKFKAATVDEAYQYIRDCDSGKNCDGFRYLGASFAHELLVNEYGIDKYIEWNLAIARDLPDFNWRTMGSTPDIAQKGGKMFADYFEEFFGIDIDTWEKEVFAPYVLENYQL